MWLISEGILQNTRLMSRKPHFDLDIFDTNFHCNIAIPVKTISIFQPTNNKLACCNTTFALMDTRATLLRYTCQWKWMVFHSLWESSKSIRICVSTNRMAQRWIRYICTEICLDSLHVGVLSRTNASIRLMLKITEQISFYFYIQRITYLYIYLNTILNTFSI